MSPDPVDEAIDPIKQDPERADRAQPTGCAPCEQEDRGQLLAVGCLLTRTSERPQCDREPDAFEAEHEAVGGRPVRQE